MAIKTLFKFILNNPVGLMYKINKTTTEFYRAGFISTAFSEGIYDVLSRGSASCKEIQSGIGSEWNEEGLKAWLDLGVSLGELGKSNDQYRIKSSFSKKLLQPENDTWQAFLQARVEIFYNYIIKTPAFLKQNKQFEFSQSYGELFARSSRTVEPILFDITDSTIPKNDRCHLLEVGCGSGIYIKRACDRNPNLTVLGIELQNEVADFAKTNILKWKIEDRATIEVCDIREYRGKQLFDIITFYNLIYYFPTKERVNLLSHLCGFLNPGGQLVLTTLCPENDPSIQLMNLWASMTDGCGPLPHPEQLIDQLKDSGFTKIQSEKLIPGFYVFKAWKSS